MHETSGVMGERYYIMRILLCICVRADRLKHMWLSLLRHEVCTEFGWVDHFGRLRRKWEDNIQVNYR